MHFISTKPALSDHLSYVTIFHLEGHIRQVWLYNISYNCFVYSICDKVQQQMVEGTLIQVVHISVWLKLDVCCICLSVYFLDHTLILYYCLLLRELVSYIALWWGIVPESTSRALYRTSQHCWKTVLEGEDNRFRIKKKEKKRLVSCLLWLKDKSNMATVVLIKQLWNAYIINIPFQLICRIILICIVLGDHPFQYLLRK